MLRSLILAAGLLAAAPAFADTAQETRLRNAINWETMFKLYPQRALEAREEGVVGFLVKLDSAGHPTECKITHTSGHPLLDQETCNLITLHAEFKAPAGLSQSQIGTYEGAINWKLPADAGSAVAVPVAMKAGEGPEKTICKRVTKTGSLVATERVCMTKNEWQRASDESREPWDEMQGRKGMTSGN